MMKKIIIALIMLALPAVAQAETYSWIKGGASYWGTFDACFPGTCYENGEIETSNDFFVQISPVAVRKKLSRRFGLRMEPYAGYAERDLDYNARGVRFSQAEVKEIQIGGNLFLDYQITPGIAVYMGPTAGVEFSQVEGKFTSGRGSMLANTDMTYNFYPGAEAGAEYRWNNLAIGGFWRWTNPDTYQDQTYQVRYDYDRGHQIGGSLKFYWGN